MERVGVNKTWNVAMGLENKSQYTLQSGSYQHQICCKVKSRLKAAGGKEADSMLTLIENTPTFFPSLGAHEAKEDDNKAKIH